MIKEIEQWAIAALSALVILLCILLLAQSVRLTGEKAQHAQTRQAFAEQIATSERAARDDTDRYREQEKQWNTALRKVADDAQEQIDLAQRDAGDARAAGERLRGQLAIALNTIRSQAARAPADAAAGQAANQTADLLADMQRQLDEAADDIAQFADRSHAAAQAGWAAGEATK